MDICGRIEGENLENIGNAFEIMPVAAEHIPTVLEVYRQCEDFLELGPVPLASLEMVLEDLRHSSEMNGVFCGIFVQGEMAGVVDYVPNRHEGRDGTALLSLLMIARQWRGAGLGSKVVNAVEREMRRCGARTVLSGVQANNPSAIRFWQRMGYRITGGPDRMPDSTVCFSLEKTLP